MIWRKTINPNLDVAVTNENHIVLIARIGSGARTMEIDIDNAGTVGNLTNSLTEAIYKREEVRQAIERGRFTL